MVRLGRIRSKQSTGPPENGGQNNVNMPSPRYGGHSIRNNASMTDNMSYITDVSDITNPIELGPSYSHETAGDEDVSFFTETEVSSALTGWTSVDQTPATLKVSTQAEKDVIDKHKPKKLSPINEPKSSFDELSIIMDSSDDGSVEASLLTSKLNAAKKVETWNPRPMSIDATKGHSKPQPPVSPKPPLPPPSPKPPLAKNKSVQFESSTAANNAPQDKTKEAEVPAKPTSPKSVLKSKTPGPISPSGDHKPFVPQSPTASISSAHKKRQPVPQLKDPNMDDTEEDAMWEQDCNYDINPTMMFQMLECGDWNDCIEFLDGKSSDNDTWNFQSLIQKGMGGGKKLDVNEMKSRQKELRSQARTWIVRRETTGVLRWRMLPIHAALVFNAPFDVVLRLYHLYPGCIRCRNDLGMLPLHHVFMYGNEDRVLELFLDVFPEALTVVDDKGRLPIGCTPQDGSDNERRSNILDLYSKAQVEMMKTRTEDARREEEAAILKDASVRGQREHSDKSVMLGALRQGHAQQYAPQRQPMQPRQTLQPLQRANIASPPPNPEASLGIAPRYTTATDFNHVSYDSIKPQQNRQPNRHPTRDIDDEKSLGSIDKYASMSDEDENSARLANVLNERALLKGELLKLGGLGTIPEDAPEEKDGGVKMVKNGLKKLFKKRNNAMASF